MICEKLAFSFEINRLKKELQFIINTHPPVDLAPGFGGWSLTSHDGRYTSGWGQNHELYKDECLDNIEQVRKQLSKRNLQSIKELRRPTEVCREIFLDVIVNLEERGFYPRRARVIRLSPNTESLWHRDAPDWLYYVRMHIPIETNENCYFECEEGRQHLPADGSVYLLNVNRMHKVINSGLTNRYHIVMSSFF